MLVKSKAPQAGLDSATAAVKAKSLSFDDLPDEGFLRQSQLIPLVLPFSSATLWRKVNSGEFPAPKKLSDRVTAWNVGSVRAWINSRGQ